MKNSIETKRSSRALAILSLAALIALCVCRATPAADTLPGQPRPGVSPEQQERMELMKSKGTEASMTILPIRVAGKPFDRVTEVVGLLLEQQGVKNVELGKIAFEPATETDTGSLAVSVGAFVRKNPIASDYALYAEYNGKKGVDELHAMVVDKCGALVWTDLLTPQDEVWKKMGALPALGF